MWKPAPSSFKKEMRCRGYRRAHHPSASSVTHATLQALSRILASENDALVAIEMMPLSQHLERDPKAIKYSGLFVEDQEQLTKIFPPKHSQVFAHHSTIAFRPVAPEGLEIGRRQEIKIIGRAWDDKGDVLLVENSKSKNAYPHITLSCAEGVDPVYCNELLAKAAEEGTIEYFLEPIHISAVEGYSQEDGTEVKETQ